MAGDRRQRSGFGQILGALDDREGDQKELHKRADWEQTSLAQLGTRLERWRWHRGTGAFNLDSTPQGLVRAVLYSQTACIISDLHFNRLKQLNLRTPFPNGAADIAKTGRDGESNRCYETAMEDIESTFASVKS
jgi:hypothetical protein